MSSTAPPHARATARTWVGLLLLLLPALLVSMDISILFVAAPEISVALEPTASQMVWAMDIYGFVIAGLLLPMGGLGDRIGRRRLLIIGAVLFGIASALLAFAPTAEILIVARAALAVGGATLAPSTLALIRDMFASERQRGVAVSAWTVAFAGGSVLGPIVGGVLLEHFWWGSVFLVNVPVMLVLVLAAPWLLPESRSTTPHPYDLPGAALVTVSIIAAAFAVKHTVSEGPDAASAVAVVLAAIGVTAYVLRHRRIAYPLIDASLFRNRRFSAAVAANATVALALTGLGSLAFTFVQTTHALSALQAALWALPAFAGTLVGAGVAAAIPASFPRAAILVIGVAIAGAGFCVVAWWGVPGTLWTFLLGYLVITTGAGLATPTASALILSEAPPARTGSASGLAESSTELGGAMGIAILGTAAATVYTRAMHELAPSEPRAFETVGGGMEVFRGDAEMLQAVIAAYGDGVVTASLIGAGVCLLAGVVLAVALRHRSAGSSADTKASAVP
ncbi:MFS transporter [Streptomonospora sp. NEAU-YY374]|nr:MFS transporter [Streptomonospora nanhaiensis]MBV2363538.1 MFS transporter [Streptomonospora nanhaiensis]